jgi:hypothetical protein
MSGIGLRRESISIGLSLASSKGYTSDKKSSHGLLIKPIRTKSKQSSSRCQVRLQT